MNGGQGGYKFQKNQIEILRQAMRKGPFGAHACIAGAGGEIIEERKLYW
jgi:hypothetical protein